MRGGQSERHRRFVGELVARGFETHGFRRKLASAIVGHDCTKACACEPHEGTGPACCWRELHDEIRVLFPRIVDAFRIHADEGRVEIAEVTITHDLPADKIEHIRDLGAWLDEEDNWSLTVIHVGCDGRSYEEPWHRMGSNDHLFELARQINESRNHG